MAIEEARSSCLRFAVGDGYLIDPIDLPEVRYEYRITIINTCDFPELRAVTRFVLYDFFPNLDLAEQERSAHTENVAVFLFATDHVSEGINSVGSYVAGVVRIPDIVPHVNAVQSVITAPKPPWVHYLPSPVGHDLSHTNAVVFEVSCKLILILVYRHRKKGPVAEPQTTRDALPARRERLAGNVYP